VIQKTEDDIVENKAFSEMMGKDQEAKEALKIAKRIDKIS
jgi:hypothetical protein